MRNLFFALAFAALFFSCENKPAPAVQTAPPPSPKPARPAEPEWARNAVLYECNIRQFSPSGDFAGVKKQLPRLKELGTDVLWLMPIHPIGKEKRKMNPGDLGSPYSVQDYYAINPDFGTLDDLKSLVSEAHALGLKVILDWVPNHTAWDAVWMKEHPEFYTKINGAFTTPINEHGQPTGWDDCADLDYSNPDLRKAMIAAMQYWVRTCDIDGYRVDMAGLVPNDFWMEARPALDSVKLLFMLSEWQDEPAHFNSCFNANYGWKWKDVTRDIAAGNQNAKSLDTLLNFLDGFYPKDYYQLYFTSNHDENSWSGTDAELYGSALDAFNVLMFTWQGTPMLYNGQEDGLARRLKFFEKDPIRWKKYAKTDFFQKLCTLRHTNQALWSGKNGGNLQKISTDSDEHVYAFTREKNGDRAIVVLNLSKNTRTVNLAPSSDVLGAYLNLFGASTVQVTPKMTLTLKPWEYLVLTNK
ncbi:MAG: alpha-glucosidase C-terminal domain-containing protein [Saprospiraceae bacterium]|nr:alpha-glucosidase C-terminal domain-containing protein [Saprospiraceae bacterium]